MRRRPARSADLARELTDLETIDPYAIRQEILRVLRQASDADFSISHGITELHDGNRVMTDVHFHGREVPGLVQTLLGAPQEVTRSLPIERLPDAFLRGFASARQIAAGDFESSPVYQCFWKPFGITDIGGLLVFHGRTLIAIVSVAWTRPKQFGEDDQRRLSALVKPVQALLIAAFFLARRGLPDEPAYVLLRASGRVESASRAGEAWLDRDEVAAALRGRVRDLHARREPAESSSLEMAEARIVRLRTDEGVRYLACLQPASWLERPAEMILTSLQRAIAEATASGMTVAEIASDVERSPETVRDHLAAVYRKLGVSSRLALAEALRR